MRLMSARVFTGIAIMLALLALAVGPARAAIGSTSGGSTSGGSTAAGGFAMPAGVRDACASAASGRATCAALLGTPAARISAAGVSTIRQSSAAVADASTPPAGFTPADLQSAYGLHSSTAGSLQTVAVVTAYDDPDAESDLATYRSQYGIAACTTADGCFSKVNQTGGTTYPGTSAGWSASDAQSLDMISAICPNCHIVLVEASSSAITDLGTAENEAVMLGAMFIDNDWASPEATFGSTETSYDALYFNHPGIAITAPAGDAGYGVDYPAASPYVIAVGGTTLTKDSTAPRGWTEAAWSGSGSGCSAYEPKPAWQTDTGCSDRTVNDVAAVADPNTPVNFYDTPTAGGWSDSGGTDFAAAIVAASYALAGTPAPGTNPASYPYLHPGGSYTTPGSADPYADGLNDLTAGSNGTCAVAYLCTAGTGYDGPTGVGSLSSFVSVSGSGATAAGPFYGGIVNKCIDDTGNATSNGNKIQIWDCNGAAAQNWTAEADGTVRIGGTHCLDVTNGGTANGTKIQLWSCLSGDANQQWQPTSNGSLVNPQSGKCLDDPGSSTTNGTQLQIFTCNGSPAQLWRLPYALPSGTGTITSQITTSKCVDDFNGSSSNNNKIDIWNCNGNTAAQTWTVEGNGTIRINGSCMVTDSDGTANGTKIVLYGCTGDTNQHWVPLSDGALMNTRSGTCLDDPSATTTNGTQLQIWTCSGVIQQSWNLP